MLENESCIYLLLIFMFYAACLYLVINEVSSPYIFSFFVSNLPCYCPCFSRMSDECDLQTSAGILPFKHISQNVPKGLIPGRFH